MQDGCTRDFDVYLFSYVRSGTNPPASVDFNLAKSILEDLPTIHRPASKAGIVLKWFFSLARSTKFHLSKRRPTLNHWWSVRIASLPRFLVELTSRLSIICGDWWQWWDLATAVSSYGSLSLDSSKTSSFAVYVGQYDTCTILNNVFKFVVSVVYQKFVIVKCHS